MQRLVHRNAVQRRDLMSVCAPHGSTAPRHIPGMPDRVMIVVLALAAGAIGHHTARADNPRVAVAQCDLSVNVQPAQRRLEASGTLRLPAVDKARDTVELSLRSDMADLRIDVLSPQASAGPIELRDRGSSGSRTDKDWSVRPRHPFPAGAKISLKVSYSGGRKQSLVFYLGRRGLLCRRPEQLVVSPFRFRPIYGLTSL